MLIGLGAPGSSRPGVRAIRSEDDITRSEMVLEMPLLVSEQRFWPYQFDLCGTVEVLVAAGRRVARLRLSPLAKAGEHQFSSLEQADNGLPTA